MHCRFQAPGVRHPRPRALRYRRRPRPIRMRGLRRIRRLRHPLLQPRPARPSAPGPPSGRLLPRLPLERRDRAFPGPHRRQRRRPSRTLPENQRSLRRRPAPPRRRGRPRPSRRNLSPKFGVRRHLPRWTWRGRRHRLPALLHHRRRGWRLHLRGSPHRHHGWLRRRHPHRGWLHHRLASPRHRHHPGWLRLRRVRQRSLQRRQPGDARRTLRNADCFD